MKPKQISDLMSQGNLDDNSEILKMPIPLIEKIMKRIDKQIERENKAFKK